MSDENLSLSIEAMIPRITEQVAADLRKKATDRFEYAVHKAVEVEVTRYIEENIVPHVAKELEAHDAEIRAAFVAGVKAAALLTAEAITENARKKLSDYQGDAVIRAFVEKVFGKGY